jgi:hypothetical protein
VELRKVCTKYDVNGDGNFSIKEVTKIVHDMLVAQNHARSVKKLAFSAILALAVVCFALIGLTFAANEMSKESHATSGKFLDTNGRSISALNADMHSNIEISDTVFQEKIVDAGETILDVASTNSTMLRIHKKIKVGTVPKATFLDGAQNLKSNSVKGTAVWTRTNGFEEYFTFKVASGFENEELKEMFMQVDLNQGILYWYAVVCDLKLGASECDLMAMCEVTDDATRRLIARMQYEPEDGRQNSDFANALGQNQLNRAGRRLAGASKDNCASDRRLKYDIKLVGQSASGIPIYTWRYNKTMITSLPEGLFRGAMAQDLLAMGHESAVTTANNGFYAVKYSQIDVTMEAVVAN